MRIPQWMMPALCALLLLTLFPRPAHGDDAPLVRYHLGVYLESDQPVAVYPLLKLDWLAFRHKVHARWAQGYQVIDLEISPDNERFSAVLGLGSAQQQITVGQTQTTFLKQLQVRTRNGYSLTDLEVTRDGHGRMRYAGVWTRLGEPRLVSVNMSYAQFMSQNAARQAMGWELLDVECAASEALTLHYSAIWQPAGQPTIWVAPSSWPEFHTTYHDFHQQGYRLFDFEQQADGRYFGVFVASCAADFLWAGRDFMGSPTTDSELSDPLGPEHLIDYEVIYDTEQGSDHPEKQPPGPDPCGYAGTLYWEGPSPISVNMVNEYPLQAEIEGLPKGLRLHNTGSAGPGN